MTHREIIGLITRWAEVDRCTKELGSVRYEIAGESRQDHDLMRNAGNLVLQDTIERLFAGKLYADIPRGLFLVRGENVLLLGEIVSRRSAA